MHAAVTRARSHALPGWQRPLGRWRRAALLKRIIDHPRKEQGSLCSNHHQRDGKTNKAGRCRNREMHSAVRLLPAEIPISFCRTISSRRKQLKSYITFEPLGVILGIMPWNYPFWQVFRFAVPTIIAGNACLLKHASNVPMAAMEIERLFVESGYPRSIFQTLLTDAGTAGRTH